MGQIACKDGGCLSGVLGGSKVESAKSSCCSNGPCSAPSAAKLPSKEDENASTLETATAVPSSGSTLPQPSEETPLLADEGGPDDKTAQYCWTVGEGGVVDISPAEATGKLLYREIVGVNGESYTPSDGGKVTVELEAFEVSAGSELSVRLPRRRFEFSLGSGNVACPEELELSLPRLKKGSSAEVLSEPFGAFGAMPEGSDWKDLSSCHGKKILLKVHLVEAEELCLASIGAEERLDYAKDRKEAGGRYFKRGCFHAALERYSLSAEMLGHTDDIKNATKNLEAKEIRQLCELNAAACLLKLSMFREAEQVTAAVLRLQPDNEKALFRHAKALTGMGDGARAQRDLRKVLEINPGNVEAKQLLQQARRDGRGSAEEKRVYAKMMKK
eukprot:TRINITY_DN3748_c1_g2_i1.p1 TRINITY_DN3748_c1_g2~~TRINITY_DN3748_c1_g2_i1.p1  ORF type:complete len:387 (+),score=107.67 TRINITY_DN3748_c1_g2_i1:93-1253(+)